MKDPTLENSRTRHLLIEKHTVLVVRLPHPCSEPHPSLYVLEESGMTRETGRGPPPRRQPEAMPFQVHERQRGRQTPPADTGQSRDLGTVHRPDWTNPFLCVPHPQMGEKCQKDPQRLPRTLSFHLRKKDLATKQQIRYQNLGSCP